MEWIVNISETVSSLHGLRTVYATVAFHTFLMTCLTDWHDLTEIYYIMYLFTAIGLLPGGSGYFTCKQNMKLVTTEFK